MASKTAQLLLAAVTACGGLFVLTGSHDAVRAQDAGSAASAPAATEPAAQERVGDRPPFRAGGDRLRQQAQQRLNQQQQQPGGPGWPFDRPNKVGMSATAPTEDEWQQTAELLEEISPTRWRLFEQVINKPHRAERAKRFLFARYAELRDLEKANPSLYGARVEQVKVEDEIFRIDTELRSVQSPGEADRLRGDLREKVADWVRKDLDERELRIRQLQDRLDKERRQLDLDKARVDEIADRRVEVIRRSSDRFRAWAAGGKFAAEEQGPSRAPRPVPPSTDPDGPPARE